MASHPTKATFSGKLPEPYKTYTVEIEVNEETRDVIVLNIFRGEEEIKIPKEIISKLKQVRVNSVYIAHSMFRDETNPSKPILLRGLVPASDSFYVMMEIGEYKSASLNHEGEEYEWTGKDRFVIRIDKDNKIETHIMEYKIPEKLND